MNKPFDLTGAKTALVKRNRLQPEQGSCRHWRKPRERARR
jgi:hypothetical protein